MYCTDVIVRTTPAPVDHLASQTLHHATRRRIVCVKLERILKVVVALSLVDG